MKGADLSRICITGVGKVSVGFLRFLLLVTLCSLSKNMLVVFLSSLSVGSKVN